MLNLSEKAMGNNHPSSPSYNSPTYERSSGTQSAVAEARRETGGKYNIVCIKAGHNYDITGIMSTLYKTKVSFNFFSHKHSSMHSLPGLIKMLS